MQAGATRVSTLRNVVGMFAVLTLILGLASLTQAAHVRGGSDAADNVVRIAPMTPQPIQIEGTGFMSIGPPPGGRPMPAGGPVCSVTADANGSDGATPQPIGSSLGPIPVTPQAALPGICVGGTAAGTNCTTNATCTGGGTCNLSARTDVYQNLAGLFGYTGCATGPNCPQYLDDFTLATGGLSFPPARFTSVETGWVTRAGRAAQPGVCCPTSGTGACGASCTANNQCAGATPTCTTLPTGTTMRVEVRFWNLMDDTPAPPAAVNTGFLGGVSFLIPGPLSAGTGTQTSAAYLQIIPLTFATGIAPTRTADLGVQVDYRNNVTNAFTQGGSPLFAGAGVTIGSSANVFWDDDNADGTFATDEGFFFTAGPPTLSNAYLHLGAQNPTAESEPNNTQAAATGTARCLTLAAAISPVADVDFYTFTLGAGETIVSEVSCGAPTDDSTLTLRNSGGGQIDFNDDKSGGDFCSKLTNNLAAGTYFLEVHEKNDDATITNYNIGVGPPPAIVTNLLFNANKHAITWNPVVGGAPYDIIYGDVQTLHTSGITASTGGCLQQDIATPASDDSDSPSAGQGFWYVSRSRNNCTGGTGTYDEGGNQLAPRDPLIPAPPIDCSRP